MFLKNLSTGSVDLKLARLEKKKKLARLEA